MRLLRTVSPSRAGPVHTETRRAAVKSAPISSSLLPRRRSTGFPSARTPSLRANLSVERSRARCDYDAIGDPVRRDRGRVRRSRSRTTDRDRVVRDRRSRRSRSGLATLSGREVGGSDVSSGERTRWTASWEQTEGIGCGLHSGTSRLCVNRARTARKTVCDCFALCSWCCEHDEVSKGSPHEAQDEPQGRRAGRAAGSPRGSRLSPADGGPARHRVRRVPGPPGCVTSGAPRRIVGWHSSPPLLRRGAGEGREGAKVLGRAEVEDLYGVAFRGAR